MPIPAFTAEGYLPEGVHACTLAEVQERFGRFQRSDIRCRLYGRLAAFIREANATGFVVAIIVDGSFATAKDEPNDIDLIVVLRSGHDFSAMLRPFEYNVVSVQQVRRMFQLDALVAGDGEPELEKHVRLFSRVRERNDIRKGMLRISP